LYTMPLMLDTTVPGSSTALDLMTARSVTA
jgi:hypothetical protein